MEERELRKERDEARRVARLFFLSQVFTDDQQRQYFELQYPWLRVSVEDRIKEVLETAAVQEGK